MATTNSGVKRVLMNTRERATSEDFNEQQQFAARSRAEAARVWYDTTHNNRQIDSTETPHTALGTVPLSAVLFGGFNLSDLGGDLQVAAGHMACVFPDGTPDPQDSPYRIIEDPGSTPATTLTFQTNGGPGSRVDLLEVQPIDISGATEVRDVRDATTNQFAPQNVVKEQSTQLVYRLRQGTPGSGCPAPVADWLPIYAVNTPSTAVDYTTCDIYDLRPEMSERPTPSDIRSGLLSWSENLQFSIQTNTVAGTANFTCATWGYGVPGSSIEVFTGPSKFGGNFIAANSPGPTVSNLDLNDVRNQDVANPPIVENGAIIAACFPQGLPRWQLCLRTNRSERHPGRGVCILSNLPGGSDGSGSGLVVDVPDLGDAFYRVLGITMAYAAPAGGNVCTTLCTSTGHCTFGSGDEGSASIAAEMQASFTATLVNFDYDLDLATAFPLTLNKWGGMVGEIEAMIVVSIAVFNAVDNFTIIPSMPDSVGTGGLRLSDRGQTVSSNGLYFFPITIPITSLRAGNTQNIHLDTNAGANTISAVLLRISQVRLDY